MPRSRPSSVKVADAIARSANWLSASQEGCGSFAGDYGGPLFLLPLYVLTAQVIGLPISRSDEAEMSRYILGHQNPDGGFGLHVEGESAVYGTVTNYVCLRILGHEPSEPALARALEFLHRSGGPRASASWGKFFLALYGLYPFEALVPVPPELWLVPESAPIHPSRLWCHARMVYLPMSHLYRQRSAPKASPLILALREELYGNYAETNFQASNVPVYSADNLSPQGRPARMSARLLKFLEPLWTAARTKRSLSFVLHQIEREDHNTDYICIGPISKLLNTLVWFYEDPHGPELRRHKERMPDYLYQADDGLKMQGYNSSRLWDTTFAVQALLTAGLEHSKRQTLQGAHHYIEQNQVLDDVRDPRSAYRHPSKGGWPFSNRAHGWPISDCTAEGIKAAIKLAPYVDNKIPDERIEDAVRLLLSLQNPEGGWATYENRRGSPLLEALNPSDCFRDIMVDYSYVECTSASIQALSLVRQHYPEFQPPVIEEAIRRGRDFIFRSQRPDGSFEGSWGVCFTYGAWFAVAGLRAAGVPVEHKAIRKARAFLESKQNADGGFGESVNNCLTRTYESAHESQVVMTSWALLALLDAGAHASAQTEHAVEFLISRQSVDGTYPNERIAGVFNKTCAIHYDNYLKIFPLWALGAYQQQANISPGGLTA